MNADELRALQAPLKEKYKQSPESAVVKLHAEGKLGAGVSIKVKTHAGAVDSGFHKAIGGDGSQACSGDMLLEALVGCAGVTLAAVATAMRIELREAKITADADWDVRGTLGLSRETPIGLQNIKMNFELNTDAPQESIDKMIQLTERYCVVLQTLKSPPPIHSTVIVKK